MARGVLLMSFGTAETLDQVPAYLAHVRGGHPAPEELAAEFRRRFQLVGGSPLTRITREQATALQGALNTKTEEGEGYRVCVGMRHAPPFIAEGLEELARAGARRIVAIVLSPQYSSGVMGGYLRAVDAARDSLPAGVTLTVAGPWYDVPAFTEALARRVQEGLTRFEAHERAGLPVVFTGHSLPRRVAESEPGYLDQLRETARSVAGRAGLAPDQWRFAYQSAGHTREQWLAPDLVDVLPVLRAAGHRKVLVAPVQFVADHLEVLYDIDMAAREQGLAIGMELQRIESLNTMPTFIQALASVVRRELYGEVASGLPDAGGYSA